MLWHRFGRIRASAPNLSTSKTNSKLFAVVVWFHLCLSFRILFLLFFCLRLSIALRLSAEQLMCVNYNWRHETPKTNREIRSTKITKKLKCKWRRHLFPRYYLDFHIRNHLYYLHNLQYPIRAELSVCVSRFVDGVNPAEESNGQMDWFNDAPHSVFDSNEFIRFNFHRWPCLLYYCNIININF